MKETRKGRVIIKTEMCKGCDLCIRFCKRNALCSSENLNKMGYHYAEPAENNECNACMVCALMCPEVAIEVYDE